jgi:hypothetical protein
MREHGVRSGWALVRASQQMALQQQEYVLEEEITP